MSNLLGHRHLFAPLSVALSCRMNRQTDCSVASLASSIMSSAIKRSRVRSKQASKSCRSSKENISCKVADYINEYHALELPTTCRRSQLSYALPHQVPFVLSRHCRLSDIVSAISSASSRTVRKDVTDMYTLPSVEPMAALRPSLVSHASLLSAFGAEGLTTVEVTGTCTRSGNLNTHGYYSPRHLGSDSKGGIFHYHQPYQRAQDASDAT